MLTWDDTFLIAKELREQNPDIDLEEVSVDMIYQWTICLPDFSDNLELANEGILMAIFQEWIEEVMPS
jgi:FeS assembly protein IscX